MWKVGDVVRLKSGGPDMTVSYVGTDGFGSGPTVSCVWWASSKMERYDFKPEMLVPADA